MMRSHGKTCWGWGAAMILSLGILSPAAVSAQEPDGLETGLELIQRGAYQKAVKVLSNALKESGGTSVPVLVALSTAHNQLKHYSDAEPLARRALELEKHPDVRALAAAELGLALALGKGDSSESREEELLETVEILRDSLARTPTGDVADTLRRHLCDIRLHSGIGPPPAADPFELAEERDNPHLQTPVKLHTPQPSSDDRRLKANEEAQLRVVIDLDGCVVQPQVVATTSERWGEIVVAKVSEWVFRPALVRGRPMPVYYTLTTTKTLGWGTPQPVL